MTPVLLPRALALAIALHLALPAPSACAQPSERSRWLMGTLFTLRGERAEDSNALDAALDHVAALESRLSNWRPASELSRLNATGSADDASEPLRAVLDSALVLAELTQGAFDPSVEPLTRVWDLRGAGRAPDAHELAAARSRVDWRRVRLTGSSVSLGGALLDLGGVGKGFALDRAAAVLRERGVRAATLDAGGQLLLLGDDECATWVAHPARRDTPAARVVFAGGSLSTSSQSERFVRAAGRRIGHILDPRSGQPLATRASVSVWAASGTRADALSTGLLVLGREAAGAFAAAHPEIGVLWLEPAGRRVRAHAWNLVVPEVAPFVSLTLHHPEVASAPLSPLTRKP